MFWLENGSYREGAASSYDIASEHKDNNPLEEYVVNHIPAGDDTQDDLSVTDDKQPVKYETRVLSVIVAPEGDAIFSSDAVIVSIEDYAAGEFLTIKHLAETNGNGEISFETEEQLSAVFDAACEMFENIKTHKKQ